MADSKSTLPEKYTLSVVVPVYNEEENVVPLTDELIPILRKIGRISEVIFVDDASTDTSLDVMRELAGKHKEVRVLSFEKNAGQSAAFDAGFKAAKNDIIITMDGDLQNDPNDIPKLLEKVREYDMVIGWRWQRRDTLIRKISSKIANAVRRRGLSDPYHDVACSLKAFRREGAMELKLFNHMHRFFPILFNIEGLTVAEVKVNHRERTHGEAKYGIRNRMMPSIRAMKFVRYMQDNKFDYRIKEEI